jgi:peptidyl-prolyl cis-trans isomerase SurA
VDKIIPAHTASFENDYNLLSEQVKQKASMKAVDDFIDSKLNTTYIVIDPLFKNCDFDRDGWYAKFSTGE